MPDGNSQKIVLITGTSSGFGLLTASQLVSKGYFVYASMRDLSKQQALLDKATKLQGQLQVRQLDVTRSDTIKKVVDEIEAKHGRIDVVVNNAGFGLGGFFEDLTQEQIRWQMEVNFFGVQNVCRQVIPLMRKQRSGKIINISSIAGLCASPALSAYNASKFALEGFSESLYHELTPFGIKVVLVEPGSYPTKIFTDNAQYAKNFEDPQSPYYALSQKLRSFVKKRKDSTRKNPQDVAKLIERIITTDNPKLRYISDLSSWLRVLISRVLPPNIYNYIFRKVIYGNSANSL